MTDELNSKPDIFMKFLEKPMFREDGRLVYAVVNAFSLSGHRVVLSDNIDYSTLGPLGPLITSLPGVRVSGENLTATELMYYVFDKEDINIAARRWKKRVRVKFDVFSNYAWDSYRGREPIIMPYPMHPWNYGNNLDLRLEAARGNDKKVRVFFSGDTKGYKRNRIMYPRPKLTRTQVVDTIIERGGSDVTLVSDRPALDEVLHGTYKRKCAIVDMNKVFVDDWLNNLARADFFICPPGYVMPMCHNTVEAMAVGTIPITNYPEWFRPSLRHMETCLAFDDEEDLLKQIEVALRLDSDDVARMRRNVIDYYERHLNPVGFVREVAARDQDMVTVLMITDLCIVEHAPRLNRNSILIRDQALGQNAGLGALLSTMRRDRRAP